MLHIVDTLFVPPFRLESLCRVYYPILHAFLAALYQTGLINKFANERDVTIFAPWDTAFQLTSGTLTALPLSELRDVLAYHIILGRVLYSSDLDNATTWATLSRQDAGMGHTNVTVTFAGNNRYIDSSQILHPDILMANGVVHMMENVLNPARPDVRPNPGRYTQAPVFALTGATSTGTKAPVPFTGALPPCTTSDCPVPPDSRTVSKPTKVKTTTTTTKGGRLSANGGVEGAVVPRCTGLAGVMGVGLVGAGMLGAAGIL